MGQQPLNRRRASDCLFWRRRRFGLAPLELVLALPVLLFVTALMINFGTLATWRVRGEIVSRDAAWRARWPGRGQTQLPSPTWPHDALSEARGGAQIGELDHPDLLHAVTRGPLPNGFAVRGILDPVDGYRQGHASIVRRYPLLPRLGIYRSGDIGHPLLDHPWTCSQMRIGNLSRRTAVLYALPNTEQSLPRALANAIRSMFAMPNRQALFVLERDTDILRYDGRFVDFHPRLRHPYPPDRFVVVERCQLDPAVVWAAEVERLVDTLDEEGQAQLRQISRLPRRLTGFFLSMYERQVAQLTRNLSGWRRELQDRRTSAERRRQLRLQITGAERELARIEPFLAPLKSYQARLGEIEDGLRAQVGAPAVQEMP